MSRPDAHSLPGSWLTIVSRDLKTMACSVMPWQEILFAASCMVAFKDI